MPVSANDIRHVSDLVQVHKRIRRYLGGSVKGLFCLSWNWKRGSTNLNGNLQRRRRSPRRLARCRRITSRVQSRSSDAYSLMKKPKRGPLGSGESARPIPPGDGVARSGYELLHGPLGRRFSRRPRVHLDIGGEGRYRNATNVTPRVYGQHVPGAEGWLAPIPRRRYGYTESVPYRARGANRDREGCLPRYRETSVWFNSFSWSVTAIVRVGVPVAVVLAPAADSGQEFEAPLQIGSASVPLYGAPAAQPTRKPPADPPQPTAGGLHGTSRAALGVRARTNRLECLSERHTGIPVFPFGERLADCVQVFVLFHQRS